MCLASKQYIYILINILIAISSPSYVQTLVSF
jgi:hypothetical protein